MPRHPKPGDVLQLHDRMYGLEPGLYVVTDFMFGMVELRATWRNEDGLLSPASDDQRNRKH